MYSKLCQRLLPGQTGCQGFARTIPTGAAGVTTLENNDELEFDYKLQSGVTHIKVIDGGHGLGPAAAPLKPLLKKMLGWSGN